MRLLRPAGAEDRDRAKRFVGRERELAEIRLAIDEAAGGRGRLLLFSGEPGIGKTHLADEAAVHAASRGMRVYWGRCFEGGGAPAYWPWIQVIRRVIADGGGQYSRTLPADIVRMLPELAAEAPHPEAGDAEQLRFRLFDAVATLLRESASVKPIMLVLDDLHDADVASLKLLKFVVRVAHDAKLIIVGTYRDAEMRRSPEHAAIIPDLLRDAVHLPLAGLAQEEVGRMVEVRAQRGLDPDFVASLCTTTAGNPLFVDGIIRVLAAEGRFGSVRPIDLTSYKLPDEVRAAIQRWLDLLSPETRTLLTTAALIGLDFELRLLEKATATLPERIAELIRSAQEIGIVISEGKSLCRFAHPLLREVLSQEPTGGERVRLHRAIATALEQFQGADTRLQISVLAHHSRESAQSLEEVDKAIDYSIRAGDSAVKALAIGEAVSRWDDALQLNKEHQRDLQQRADILARLGEHAPVNERQKLKTLEDALAIYEQLGVTTKAADVHRRLCGLLSAPLDVIDLPRAEQHFREAEALFREGPPNDSVALLYSAWCFICMWWMKVPDAFDAASRAVDIAKEHGSPWVRAQTGGAMAASLFAMGRLREWIAEEDRVWHEADQLNSPVAGGISQNTHFSLMVLRDYRESLRWLRREMTRPRNKQPLYYGFFAPHEEINLHSLMGQLDEFRRLMGNNVYPQAESYTELHSLFWAGDLEIAIAKWAAVVDFLRSRQRYETVCVVGSGLAYILRCAGHQDTSIELLKEILSYSVPGGYVPLEMGARALLSQIYAQTGHIEEARANLTRCREIMASGEDWRGLVGDVGLAEAALATAEARFDDADHHFADALQVIRRYAMAWSEGPALCEWGRALAAGGQRERALEKFDEAVEFYRRIGAGQPWIDRAEAEQGRVGSNQSDAARLGQTSVEAEFRKEGAYWTVSYGGETFRLQDSKACRVIAHLLHHPGHQFHARELAALDGRLATTRRALDRSDTDHISDDLGDAGPGLDARARAEYQSRLGELRADIDEAERDNDLGRAAKLRVEADAVSSELIHGMGIKGHERKQSSHSERARLAVTKSIRRGIEKIRELSPALGRHLTNSIRTGYFCTYAPDQENQVIWRL